MLQALYLDLDGTLLGPGGALVRGEDGGWSLQGLRALEACDRAGAEVVLMSGRGSRTLAEDARLLGQTSYVFEAGACVVVDGEEHWLTGRYRPGARSIHEQIDETGAPQLLLDHFDDLVPHDPWHRNREVSHLFRGVVDAFAADALLTEHGHDDLRLIDNGPVRDGKRAYHLVPKGVSKAAGVAFHVRARGYDPALCLAVGDSREDMTVSEHVGAMWLVGNALRKDPSIAADVATRGNVRVAEAGHGAGVYEAVVTTLAERRATGA